MFEPIDFDRLNEQDVRETILAPLLRDLGYRSGTEHDLITEQSLRYPRSFLGRKNPKKDPLLRGKADYTLVAGAKVRWVLEAKPPNTEIGADEIEQAYTYANHPEVRAVYFALSNGRRLCVFQTNRGPDVGPMLNVSYQELRQPEKYQAVKNLLSPGAILRDHPDCVIDIGVPLGPALRSVARVTNGLVRYNHNSWNVRALNELQYTITDGALQRDEEGHLVAWLRTTSPLKSVQKLNERLGLSDFEMTSGDASLSTNAREPTIFSYDNPIIFPAGEELLNLITWQPVRLEHNISCHVFAKASGALLERRFEGTFSSRYVGLMGLEMELEMSGSFTIHLA